MEEQKISYEMLRKELDELSALINRKCSQLVNALETGQMTEMPENKTYFLTGDMSELSGQKPQFVNFPDGSSAFVRTWAETAQKILQYCCQNEMVHENLKQLCDRVAGQKRMLLSSHPEIMQKPVRIADDIYMEGQNSPINTMHILKHQLLDRIRYDYSNISVMTQGRPITKQILICGSPEKTAELKMTVNQKRAEMLAAVEEFRQEIEMAEQGEIPEICEEPETFSMTQV